MKEEKITLAGAPAILCFRQDRSKASRKGSILFFHGLGASKETGRKELRSLADLGYLAIAIDNIDHGERKCFDFDFRYSPKNPKWESAFTNAVAHTAKEVPQVINEMESRGLVKDCKIASMGISMGGYIVYRSILEDRRIKVAISILGSPRWKIESAKSPHLHPSEFYPCALLSQNAGRDESVAPKNARNFHRSLEKYYEPAPELVEYIEFPDSGHFMEEKDWEVLWSNALKWLSCHL